MRRGCVEVVVLALLVACTQKRTGDEGPRFEDCMLGGPTGAARVQARCTTFDGLHVALLAAEGGRRAADPLFFIPGGPGQSGFQAFAQVAGAFALVQRHRDIVVIEPRGTGVSEPLKCATELPDDLRSADALSRLKACAAELGDKPSFINTAGAVRDLDMVRGAMGYEKINLYGASYGTRVALQMAKARPDLVRAVVLDGVIAPETSLGVEQAVATEEALRRMDRTQAIRDLAAKLGRAPVTLSLRHPVTGGLTDVVVDDRLFEDTLRMMLYQSELAALVQQVIDQAAKGNLVPLATQGLFARANLEDAVSPLVYLSVVCAEDIPFLQPGAPGLFPSRIGELIEACKLWPVSRAEPASKQPVDTDVPMFLLSGSADPVTPPREAEKVLAHAKHARSLVLKDQGHIGIVRGCVPRLVADFLDDPTAELDLACAARTQALPFFTGPNAP